MNEKTKKFICPDCKKEMMVPVKSKRQRCPECAKIRIRERFANTRKKFYTKHDPDEIITMIAICPTCGEKHKIKTLPLDADITPRVRCPQCKKNLLDHPKADPICEGYSINNY
ncbi:MAG: hypothetical protein PHC90_14380 [Syntrophorhabdaceae bacterium]|nr:hypothetical protein [Syntrophorhabdaceae bacterium]